MSQLDVEFDGSSKAAKPYADRVARLGYITPYMLSVYESTVNSGDFDRFAPLGIGAPDNAVSPSIGTSGDPDGTYSYYAAFVDSDRDVIGVVSAASSSVSPSSERVTIDLTPITNEHDWERADKIYLYRNLTSTTTFLFLVELDKAVTSYTDNATDASISANDELPLNNAAPSGYGMCLTHKNYPFFYGPNDPFGGTEFDDDYTWGNLAEPDNTPTVNRSRVDRGRGGELWAAGSMGDDLAFYKRSSIYMLQFDQNPSGTTGDGYGKTVNTERGCLNGRCLVNMQGDHYVMDREGIYQHKGFGNIQEIGRMHLDSFWRRINWEKQVWFSGAWDNDLAVWFVALDQDDECHYAFVFDVKAYRAREEYRWSVFWVPFGVRDCIRTRLGDTATEQHYRMSHAPVIQILTEYNLTGYLNAGYRDLVDPQLTAEATVTGGSATTIEASAATFERTNEAGDAVSVVNAYGTFKNWEEIDADASGAFSGNPSWGDHFRITGVSGTTLTVDPRMPGTPPNGAVFVIGGIDARIRSPRLHFDNPIVEKRAKRMILEYQRLGVNAKGRVRWRRDGRGWEVNVRTVDTDRDDIEQVEGRDYTEFNMGGPVEDATGVVQIDAPGGTFRYLEFEIELPGVDVPGVIDGISLELD